MYQSLDQELDIFIPPPQKFRNGFENLKYRLVFVRKVYGLLTLQFLLTSGFLLLCKQESFQNFFAIHNRASQFSLPNTLAMLAFSLIIMISLFVYKSHSIARRSPVNYVCFLLFTASFIYLIGYGSVNHLENAHLTIMGMNTLTVFFQLYAKGSSRFSIKKAGLILFIWSLLALICLSIFVHYKKVNLEFFSVGCIVLGICIYGIYLLYNIYRVTETGKYQLSPENHLIGNLLTYIDIMVIFCKFFGICRGKE